MNIKMLVALLGTLLSTACSNLAIDNTDSQSEMAHTLVSWDQDPVLFNIQAIAMYEAALKVCSAYSDHDKNDIKFSIEFLRKNMKMLPVQGDFDQEIASISSVYADEMASKRCNKLLNDVHEFKSYMNENALNNPSL